jgi:hypothetical protein
LDRIAAVRDLRNAAGRDDFDGFEDPVGAGLGEVTGFGGRRGVDFAASPGR